MKVLLTSTSFQDNPGKHQELYALQNFETDRLRGPIKEGDLLEIIGGYDALLCGDDELTRAVLKKGREGRLKYISKYGVGLDKIDLAAAKEFGLPVMNCPGVNQISVAEHVFGLLLTFSRKIHWEYDFIRKGHWKRLTGHELYGKTIGIIGLGAIGKEVAKRAIGFGLDVLVCDAYPDRPFIAEWRLAEAASIEDLASRSDILTLHVPLSCETEKMIDTRIVDGFLKKGVIIINTARGRLVDPVAIMAGLESGVIGGYLTDVLDIEPMPEDYPLKDYENVIITPHIGSRTYESVERQGLMAVRNLLKMIEDAKQI